jgi:hydroxypyruvate isomerase
VKRRKFIQNSALFSTATALTPSLMARDQTPLADKFQMKYAPHLGMFKNHAGEDPVDQLNFMADMGFTAFEDNGMKGRDIAVQEEMAKTMQDRGLQMGVFVAHEIAWKEPNLTNGDKDLRDKFLKEVGESVEVAKRVNAKWMTVVPGHVDLKKRMGFQTANVMESLRRACDILEPHGLVMVLEPLNFYNHPGLFLTEIPQAFELCRAVDSPACKILFDIYHQQITEGNIIPNIDAAWDEVGYFQIGDNPGRKEPTSGEINYKNIFKHIHSKGYDGILGMEHGNAYAGKEGEEKLIAAYREVDSF